MSQIYSVKQTAKILGFSTNTVYKYLNEGRLRATRGNQEQGRFRIPHQAIEEFLHTRLPEDILTHIEKQEQESKPTEEVDPTPAAENLVLETSTYTVTPTPTSLPTLVSRLIILFCLVAIIIDVITSPTISFIGQITRVAIMGAFILLSYQHVGSKQIIDQSNS